MPFKPNRYICTHAITILVFFFLQYVPLFMARSRQQASPTKSSTGINKTREGLYKTPVILYNAPCDAGRYLTSPSGFMLKDSRRSVSGRRLLRRSISGIVWSMPIWMRLRIMDISLTFWICSAYLAYRFCLSCMMLKSASTERSICGDVTQVNILQAS